MRERGHRRRRRGAAAAAVLAGALVAGPALLAQPAVAQTDDPRWVGSTFDAPLDADPAELDRSSFTVAGTIRHALYDVTEVTLALGRSVDGEFTADGPCLPDSPEVDITQVADEVGSEDGDEVRFSAPDVVWPCNGEFVVRATATADRPVGPADELVMETGVVLHAPPMPVSALDAAVDGDTVAVSWNGVDPSPDAAGFRVERAGPATEGGTFGRFRAVATVGAGTTTIADDPGRDGDYRYRVRALRDGGLISPLEGSGTADASVGEPPPETTTTTAQATSGNDRSTRRSATTSPSRGGAQRSTSSPTTIDTGFESEIDYGDGARPLGDDDDDAAGWDDDEEEPGELAAEGQSVIRTEGDGAGLVAPAAGAMVLLGWAGHLVYLNRLAKQF